jgi:hypothetical protein
MPCGASPFGGGTGRHRELMRQDAPTGASPGPVPSSVSTPVCSTRQPTMIGVPSTSRHNSSTALARPFTGRCTHCPAVDMSCHMPKYAAVACWRAVSAGETTDGVGADAPGEPVTPGVPDVDEETEPHPATTIADAATRTAHVVRCPPRTGTLPATTTPLPPSGDVRSLSSHCGRSVGDNGSTWRRE